MGEGQRRRDIVLRLVADLLDDFLVRAVWRGTTCIDRGQSRGPAPHEGDHHRIRQDRVQGRLHPEDDHHVERTLLAGEDEIRAIAATVAIATGAEAEAEAGANTAVVGGEKDFKRSNLGR